MCCKVLFIAEPSIYLSEIQEHVYDATGTWVSFSTICRTAHRLGFTKKLTTIATQQSVCKENWSITVGLEKNFNCL